MKSRLLFSLVVLTLFIFPVFSHAQTTCANATQLRADGTDFQFDFVTQSGGNNNYVFTGFAGNSYTVEVSTNYEGGLPPTALVVALGTGSCPATAFAGGVLNDTHAAEPELPVGNQAYRQSFIMPGTINTAVPVQISVTNNDTVGHYVALKITDTTLFNYSGWSTFSGYNGFYSIMNTTHANVTGTLTFYNGTSGAIVKQSTVNLTPVGTATAVAALNTSASSLNLPTNNFGYATFAHNGPPGAVSIANSIANFSINAIQPGSFLPARQ